MVNNVNVVTLLKSKCIIHHFILQRSSFRFKTAVCDIFLQGIATFIQK